MKTVQLPESEKINVISVSLKCQCKKCGWIWGLRVNTDGSYPKGFDDCNRCKAIEKEGKEND